MEFTYQERNTLSDIIEFSSISLFNAIKYIYAISEEHYYNINVKDIFKIILSDVTNNTLLENIGISLNDKNVGELIMPQFNVVSSMIYYSFLVRLPFLRQYMENNPVKESHIRELYNIGIKRGADNYGNIIDGDLRTMFKLVKNKQIEPPFDSEWFRRWVYTYSHDLALINNRNMFLLGSIEALFPLHYAAYTEKMIQSMVEFQS